ncbi:MAG TPA: hypothetical protein VFL29_15215 [Candidatus Dormibacteraeota bacterium]|nr:hypothetical protein [Candidatus Dormibacteraeota bacterium]
MRLAKLLSWIGLALGAAYLVGMGAWALFANDLEVFLLGAPLYVVPLVAVALVLRSSNSVWLIVAGVLALLGAGYWFLQLAVGVVVGAAAGNWEEVGLSAISVPVIAYYVVVFWTTVLHRTEHKAPMTPVTS